MFGVCHGCLQRFLLGFIFGKQGIKAFIGNAPDGKRFIELFDDMVLSITVDTISQKIYKPASIYYSTYSLR